jgi:hypothetical protein
MSADGDMTQNLLSDGLKLTGLSLAMLGYEPHADDLPDDERAQFEPQDLEEMSTRPPEERAESLRRARLLAGLLWHSSVVLVDQLYADHASVSEMEEITAAEIDGTWVLSSLPTRFAANYGVSFVRRFIVMAADLTGTLVRGWESPGCVAAELALRCLLDQAELTADTYELDLAEDWRDRLEEVLFEDADSEMLYLQRMDGFENDEEMTAELGLAPMRFEHWFEPFNTGYSVPPYARSA